MGGSGGVLGHGPASINTLLVINMCIARVSVYLSRSFFFTFIFSLPLDG